MVINFWSFQKKRNSTKQPPEETDFKADAILKESTSVLNPVIELASYLVENWNPSSYNYAQIEELRRYYYIKDWVYNKGVWECYMEVDALASWRAEINSTEFYILRAQNRFNSEIVDTLYPTTTDIESVCVESSASPWEYGMENGSYIIGLINGDTSTYGAVSYYAMTPGLFRTFCSKLFGSVDWMGISIEEISSELLKSLFNPFQYIASVMFVPLHYTTICGENAEQVNSLPVGWWELKHQLAFPLPSYVYEKSIVLDIPKHPQFSDCGFFVKCEPYSKYSLYFPGFGDIPLNANIVSSDNNVAFTVRLDLITGKAMLYGNGYSGDIMEHHFGQIGVPVQIAQISSNILGAVQSAATTVSSSVGSLLSLDIGGAITNAINGIASTIQTAAPQLRTSGSNGSIVEIGMKPSVRATFYKLVEMNTEEWGRPYCRRETIAGIVGYIKVASSHIEIAGFKEEADMIDAVLTEGFYNE